MGIFTRFRDIVSANINSMLDKAEDPEKMIKLMIREMEDTLVELKSACAGVIAERKKINRRLEELEGKRDLWDQRAGLAVAKGRDDLAREALQEKRRFSQALETLEAEIAEHEGLVTQYQEDICQLEDKLNSAKEKQRLLIQRHKRATGKKRAQQEIRRSNSADTMARFDQLESRIEQLEAEADLVNMQSQKEPTIDDEFDSLTRDEEIENELEKLKAAQYSKDQSA